MRGLRLLHPGRYCGGRGRCVTRNTPVDSLVFPFKERDEKDPKDGKADSTRTEAVRVNVVLFILSLGVTAGEHGLYEAFSLEDTFTSHRSTLELPMDRERDIVPLRQL